MVISSAALVPELNHAFLCKLSSILAVILIGCLVPPSTTSFSNPYSVMAVRFLSSNDRVYVADSGTVYYDSDGLASSFDPSKIIQINTKLYLKL